MAEQNAGAQQPAQPAIAIQRIYIKDLSFEAPNAPEVFRQEWKPEVNLELNNRSEKVDEDIYEVVVSLTVTTKVGDKTAYIVEVQQAGLFLIRGIDNNQLGPVLGVFCPNTLFPYAREAISDVVGKGSFPQMMLAPVNFEALFAEAVKRRQAEMEGSPEGASH